MYDLEEILNQVKALMEAGHIKNEDIHFLLRSTVTNNFIPFLHKKGNKESYKQAATTIKRELEYFLFKTLEIKKLANYDKVVKKYYNGIFPSFDVRELCSLTTSVNKRYDNARVYNDFFSVMENVFKSNKPALANLQMLRAHYNIMVERQTACYFKLNDKNTSNLLFLTLKNNLENTLINPEDVNDFIDYINKRSNFTVVLSTVVEPIINNTRNDIIVYKDFDKDTFFVEHRYDPINGIPHKTIIEKSTLKEALNHYHKVAMVNAFNNR